MKTLDTGRSILLAALLAWSAGCVTGRESAVQGDRPGGIPIIDTHIHLYDPTRPQGVPWPPESNAVLYRPVLAEDFNAVAARNGIAAAVIVEASDWVDDNRWVLDLVTDDPGRYRGVVGNLPLGTPEFEPNLARLSEDPRFVGIRMRQRPRGAGFFTDAVWRDLTNLAAMNRTLDVLMFDFSLADVDMVARRLPQLRIVMDHVAGADIDGLAPDPKWVAALERAARNPNVHCKVSGLFQQSHRQPSPVDLEFYRPVLDELWRVFGEDRLIYGSNWPVSMMGGDYASYLAVVTEYFAGHGTVAMEKVFHRNAVAFYRLPVGPESGEPAATDPTPRVSPD